MSSVRLLLAALVASSFVFGASLARAEGGCGAGYHRNPNNVCVPNGRACPYGYHWDSYVARCVTN